MRIAILAEWGGELGIEYINELLKNNLELDSIVFIGDEFDVHRKRLVDERTGGHYKRLEFSKVINGRVIPCFFVRDVNSHQTGSIFLKLNLDIVVSACTTIIKNPIWEIPKYGMLNCHSGIVQHYRGCSSIEWAIYNNDPIGSSCHLIKKEIDAGPLVYQAYLFIDKEDNYQMIRAKMIKHQAVVMAEGVKKIIEKPETFFEHFKKGKYFKPMKDKKNAKGS